MTQDSLTYSIPMKGQGSYNLHSELQRHVLVKALHLLRKATDRASRNPSSPNPDLLTVVEYGASHGSNSIPPLESILEVTTRTTVTIELNDRPENDFTTLSLTINRWESSLNKAVYPHELFVTLRPRSFYKPLSAVQVADVGYCFTCLHFLENIPDYPSSHFTAIRPQETMEMFRAQAQVDLQKFLRLRASEYVPGGQLLVSLIASGFGHPDFMDSGPGNAMRLAMREMLSEERISKEAIELCVVPIYFRTIEDIQATLNKEEVSSQWSLVEMDQSQVMHPFWDDLERKKQQGRNTEEHSVEYARGMLAWFLAVFDGFFLRALTSCIQAPYTEQEAQAVMQESQEKAVRIFVEKYRDDPVYISSVYVLLEKKA